MPVWQSCGLHVVNAACLPLILQGRESSNEYSDLQAYFPMLERIDALVDDLKSWREAVLYKHGPRHDLDLVEKAVLEELFYARFWRQDAYASDEEDSSSGELWATMGCSEACCLGDAEGATSAF